MFLKLPFQFVIRHLKPISFTPIFYLVEFEDIPFVNVAVLPFVKRRVAIRMDAYDLLWRVCELIQHSISSSHLKKYYTNSVLEATRQNEVDVVKRIVRYFPNAFWSASEDGHNVIQHAVINHSEKIYNLLYEMSEHKNVYKTSKDSSGNNLLHLAARLAPAEKLNLISGAALQIQYELQWYKVGIPNESKFTILLIVHTKCMF